MVTVQRRIGAVTRPPSTPVSLLRLFARAAAVATLVSLGGCAVQLAPAYNQSIVDGLNQANTQTMTLFAAISNGTNSQDFAARQPQYNAVIGQFSALETQLEARPMPPPPTPWTWIAGRNLASDASSPLPVFSSAPSIASLKHLVGTLSLMRDTDRSQGLPPSSPAYCGAASPNPTACLFENSYKADFINALTYETALQR